jgi:hypothetical protein
MTNLNNNDFTLTIESDQSAEVVFQAILNVREWWSGYYDEEFDGNSEMLNDEFSFRAGGGLHYSKQKIVELSPNKKVVWLITDSELSFLDKKDEWTGSHIIFEITEMHGKTQLSFTHKGLTPEIECYDSCAPAWTQYLQNKLLPLISRSTA